MRRRILIQGDKTTVGGVVLDGVQSGFNGNIPIAFHGSTIWCPVCKTNGRLVNDGPRQPMSFNGVQVALENDLCVCKCMPPPRLVASTDNMSMSFEASELSSMGYQADGSSIGTSALTAVAGLGGAAAVAFVSMQDGAPGQAQSFAGSSTPLGGAQAFEYLSTAQADGAIEVAGGGYTLSPEQQEDCMMKWEKDQDDCQTFGKMMGGSRGVAMCLEKARFRYNLCMGYTRPI
ncbi:PAAR domain-containing protein [Burkholderia stagnalis]|uniref:PAAR domain-containing protein n=1 Tax=Burkholderia stagnalis TaxID=1503054 RepID=UPI0009BE7CDE|nr:PAAR domain-containing protein [Burkholderia stagnalis]